MLSMIARLRNSSLIAGREEDGAHILAQLGDALESLREQEVLGRARAR